jgi:predicted PurR-regulated permease PerM
MPPERVVSFRPRAVLSVLGVLLAVGVVLWILYVAHQVISWMLISLFLALAINPAVEALRRRGVERRGLAAGLVFATFVVIVAAIAAAFIPTLVNQVTDFVDAIPGYVRDLTHGRGRLGFLETKYHVVERVQSAINNRKGSGLLGSGAGTVISVTKGIITGVVATVTIIFMTFFMLLEGPAWMERFYGLFPADQQERWRDVAHQIYRTVGGYVTGNLLISVIAGGSATIVLLILGVPFAVALGLLVAILDLIPLAGATLAAILVSLVALSHSLTAAIITAAFFVVYQQIENHLLQPLVYGRTVQLSPLAVLIAVLIGAEVAGVLGALGAIPIAGTLQILLIDWQRERQRRRHAAVIAPDEPPPPPGAEPAPQITAPAS